MNFIRGGTCGRKSPVLVLSDNFMLEIHARFSEKLENKRELC